MTIEEAKVLYGKESNNYYIFCKDCPITYASEEDQERFCPAGCDGRETTWKAIADYANFTNPVEQTEPEVTTPEYDVVSRPKHYCREGAMECIDEMVLLFGKEAVKHFCICNAWKYRYRSAEKNGTEDLNKSDWYVRKYKELSNE